MKCNLPYLDRKDHPNSKHGRIELCLKLMANSGRKCFTAVDVEKSTGVLHRSISGILIFTKGVQIEMHRDHHKERIWYFTGEEIEVPIYSRRHKK